MRRRQALHYPQHRVRQAALRVLSCLGYQVSVPTPAGATVVILSYKRMGNIPAIARSALLCGFVDKVIVSNNNPEVDLGPYLPSDDPRLELVQQDRRRSPSYRYDLARRESGEYYICIDDDVFPSPWQLRRMFTALLVDPSSPRGTAGEVYDRDRRKLIPARPRRRSRGDGAVDVILHTYAFTRAHLERYFELLTVLGVDNHDVLGSEDVIISFTGRGRPVADRVGFVYECATAHDPEIATYRRDGFDAARNDLYRQLHSVR